MTDDLDDKPVVKPKRSKKPPTQTAGVNGIDAHGSMGEALENMPRINWHLLINLPAFELFVYEQSGQPVGASANDWVRMRRASLGDDALYDQYASWHKTKGLWVNETPTGKIITNS